MLLALLLCLLLFLCGCAGGLRGVLLVLLLWLLLFLGCCGGVAGMLLEPLMGQPPPPLFDFIGHPSARATLAVAAAAAADA